MKLKYYFSLGLLLVLNINLIYGAKTKQQSITKDQVINNQSIKIKVNNLNINTNNIKQESSDINFNAKEFNLHDVLSIAYLRSPKFKINIANYKKNMHEAIGTVSGLFLPSINASMQFSNSRNGNSAKSFSNINLDNETTQNSTLSNTRLSIRQSIFNFGKDVLTAKSKYNEILARQAAFYQEEQKLVNDIISKFIDVQINEEIYKASKISLKNNAEIYKSEQKKYEVGYSTLSDLKAAESRYYASISDENQRKLVYENSIDALNLFLNIDNLKDKKLVLTKLPLSVQLNFDELKAKVLNNNYDLLSAKYNLLAAQSATKSAVANLLPKISGQINLDSEEQLSSNFQSTFAKKLSTTIAVDIPIFNGGQEYASIRSSKSQSVSARYNEFDAKNISLLNLQALINQLNNLQLQYSSAEFSYNAAKISSKAAEEKYKLGQGSFIDFIATQESEYKRQLDFINIKKSLITTWYQILALQGQLTAAKLNLNGKIFKPDVELKKNSILLIGF